MEYIQLTLDDYIQSKEEIKKDLGGIVKSFVRIGWQLTRINNAEAYKMDGYKTIAEFAKAEYGMNPSGVTRFMQVYEKYSVPGDVPELQEKYREFNLSQLTEMLQLTDEERDMFRPESKREDIREYKNFTKENENNPDNLLNWKQEPQDMIGKTILEFFRNNKDDLNELYGSEAYTSGDIKGMAEIVNPSGNRHYRHKTVFMMMYDYNQGLMINEFGKSQESMKWEEFFAITQEIFKDAAAGSRTWEAYFAPAQKEEQAEEREEQKEEQTEEPTEEPKEEPQEEPKEPSDEQIPEQDRIDRETQKKLKDKAQEEKMSHLPSDAGQQVHKIRLPSNYFEDVAAGVKTFELRKNDRHYRKGDILELMEFTEGRNTGRLIRAEVTYLLEDYTGLEDGYCIMAIKVIEVK